MHNTKATFSTIDTTDLTGVLGGCGGKRRCKSCCGTTINNNITQAAPAAPQSSGTAVDVSVSGY